MRGVHKLVSVIVGSLILVALARPLWAAAQTVPAGALPRVDQSTVVVKLKATAEAQLVNGTFVGSDGQSIGQLNQTLALDHAVRKQALIGESKQLVQQRHAQLPIELPANQGNLDDYYTIKLAPGVKASDVAAQLQGNGAVETAYAKPLPTPAPSTPDFSGNQAYLKLAPTGLGVNATIGGSATAMPYPGTSGAGVQVADVEYSWNTAQEDLLRLRLSGALWANGTPVDPFADTNHGTAVAGIIIADHNGIGVNGIVANTNYHMVNANNTERGWDVANAVYTAANKMIPGDVLLIEQQAWAPDGQGFAPIETYPDVYDAVTYATAKGINVVEPAGNGKQSYWQGYDLSDPQFSGIFTTARTNSGAIIVGAGGTGCSTPARARMPFSNYGSRVDLQGIGECVTTTGYGYLYNNSANVMYTADFNGTSSASATIAGVAAELSSSYKQIDHVALTPSHLKSMLLTGGSAQNNTVNPGKIGVLPNMAAVLPLTDITKPSAPSSLVGTWTATNKTTLTWKASSDSLGYVKYYVYRNGAKLTTVSKLTYIDASVRPKTNYTYKVLAVDASNNLSTFSNSVTVLNR